MRVELPKVGAVVYHAVRSDHAPLPREEEESRVWGGIVCNIISRGKSQAQDDLDSAWVTVRGLFSGDSKGGVFTATSPDP